MENQFVAIKKAYDDFYSSRLASGKLILKDTGIGYWGISVSDELFELFKQIDLGSYKSFLDIGSGDGKAVLIASLFTKAAGIEFDDELHSEADKIHSRFPHPTTLYHGDLLKHDISSYDLVFINPDKPMSWVEHKIRREFKGRLLVYGSHYLLEGRIPKRTINVGTPVHIFDF